MHVRNHLLCPRSLAATTPRKNRQGVLYYRRGYYLLFPPFAAETRSEKEETGAGREAVTLDCLRYSRQRFTQLPTAGSCTAVPLRKPLILATLPRPDLGAKKHHLEVYNLKEKEQARGCASRHHASDTSSRCTTSSSTTSTRSFRLFPLEDPRSACHLMSGGLHRSGSGSDAVGDAVAARANRTIWSYRLTDRKKHSS